MFVTFEGIDGSGKSTAIHAVANGVDDAWMTAEETPEFGEAIRRSIRDGAEPLVTTYLFLGDRFRHQGMLKRHILEGQVVLCDRYMHSTRAYQGVTLEGVVPDHRAWLAGVHRDMIQPDLVLWFDVPAEEAVARVQGRGASAPYEKVSFLEKVAAEYAAMADEPNVVRIDASQSPEHVARDALAAVQAALAKIR